MKVTLIHNPRAGDDLQPSAGQIEALIREAGHKVRLQSVKERGWSRILSRRADLVAVAGGDGTLSKVARRLVGTGVPIAALPTGTANNIAKSLGLAGLPLTRLIPGWASARRPRCDAGVAVGPWGVRHFIEGVGTGLFTQALPRIERSKTMSSLSGGEVKVTYALQLMRELLEEISPKAIEATLDGTDISGKYLLFEAMVARFIGPNLLLAPHIAHGDGMLDVVFLTDKDRRKLARYLATWQEGKAWPSELGVARGRRLALQWTGFPLHIDDKTWPKAGKPRPKPPARIEIALERRALEFLVPARPGGHGAKHRRRR